MSKSVSDLISEAEVLHHYGRTEQAVLLLREALLVTPNQPELQAKLRELEERLTSRPSAGLGVMLIPWFLSLAIGVCIFGGLFVASRHLDRLPLWFHDGWGLVAFFVAGAAILVVAVILWTHLVLHCWFRYLRFQPLQRRLAIEAALPRYFNTAAFEPTYTRVRGKYFPK